MEEESAWEEDGYIATRENRCSNAPPRDYVHRAGALSRRVIMRGAIICGDDDKARGIKKRGISSFAGY